MKVWAVEYTDYESSYIVDGTLYRTEKEANERLKMLLDGRVQRDTYYSVEDYEVKD